MSEIPAGHDSAILAGWLRRLSGSCDCLAPVTVWLRATVWHRATVWRLVAIGEHPSEHPGGGWGLSAVSNHRLNVQLMLLNQGFHGAWSHKSQALTIRNALPHFRRRQIRPRH